MAFNLGIANSLSNDAFTSYIRSQRLPGAAGFDPANVGQYRTDALAAKQAQGEQMKSDMFMQGLMNYEQFTAGRGMPQRNIHQMRGYENVQDPSQFQMETTLPFDEKSEKSRNFEGIVNSFNPQLFGVSEQIVNQVAQMGPAAEKALTYRTSIYTGVPDDFAVNRLYIAATRQRENSVYAFK